MMKLICPNCGEASCVATAEEVTAQASHLYAKCKRCQDLSLDKQSKIDLSDMHFEDFACVDCGKRPLDAVMGHILSVAVHDKKNPDFSLRGIGTPLLSPNVPLYASPHLSSKSLVILTNKDIVADAADRIMQNVPEVKAVLYGDVSKVIGLAHTQTKAYTCHVLAGCDLRADLVTSAYGQLLIYRSQSKIHIEHDNRTKMHKLGNIPLAGAIVFDALAGPGTLGLMSVLMGAKKVILNDAWHPAVKDAYLNMCVNKRGLGLHSIKRTHHEDDNPYGTPTLFCTARGDSAELELYEGTFERFFDQDFDVDVVLVDAFPGTEFRLQATIRKIKHENPAVRVFHI
ncbi:MAG: hypothetical protein ACXVIG_07785 [Halobacteriota archaeon]